MTNIGSIFQAGAWVGISALLMLAVFEPVAIAQKADGAARAAAAADAASQRSA